MHVAPSSSKKKNFTMSLKTSPRLIHVGATRVSGGGVIYHRWTFFPFFSFSSPENHKFVLFIVDISTLAFIILYFFS